MIEALSDALRIENGLTNHSYVRCCPEQIYSFSGELKSEILFLDNTQLRPIAVEWRRLILIAYETDRAMDYTTFFWRRYETSDFYSVEFFEDVLLNVYEIIRYCDPEDTLYISVDY